MPAATHEFQVRVSQLHMIIYSNKDIFPAPS